MRQFYPDRRKGDRNAGRTLPGTCGARICRDAGDCLARCERPASFQGARKRKAFPLCLRTGKRGGTLRQNARAFSHLRRQHPRGRNLVVLKTLPGSGPNAGVVIDELAYREVVGSIAGDDTVLLICETAAEGGEIAERLSAIVKG